MDFYPSRGVWLKIRAGGSLTKSLWSSLRGCVLWINGGRRVGYDGGVSINVTCPTELTDRQDSGGGCREEAFRGPASAHACQKLQVSNNSIIFPLSRLNVSVFMSISLTTADRLWPTNGGYIYQLESDLLTIWGFGWLFIYFLTVRSTWRSCQRSGHFVPRPRCSVRVN